MSGSAGDDKDIELHCPECGAVVHVSVEKAERDNKALCPKGHEIPIAKALG